MGRVYHKRKDGKPAGPPYVDYRDHRGRRVRCRAFGCRTDKEAAQHLADLEAEVRETKRLIKRGLYDGRTNAVPVRAILEAYLVHQVATKQYGTVHATRTALADTLGRFERPGRDLRGHSLLWPPRQKTRLADVRAMPRTFVPGPLAAELGVELVADITKGVMEDWAAARCENLAPRTIELRVKTLKAALNWAAEAGKIKDNPVAGYGCQGRGRRGARGAARRPWRALASVEVAALLDASPEPYRTFWLAFVTTGMRHGELVALAWPEVSFATNTLRVRAETSKAGGQRDIPLAPALLERLEVLKAEASDPAGLVFLNAAGRPWRNNLEARFKRCAQRAGLVSRIVWKGRRWHLEYTDADGRAVREALQANSRREAEAVRRERCGHRDRRVVIHSLRHTFAAELIRQGVNIKVVSELLGHSTIQMTLDIYGHVFPQDKQEAVSRLSFGTGTAPAETARHKAKGA